MATGAVTLSEPGDADTLSLDDKSLRTVHGPRWRLLVIGAGQMTEYLATMALALDYDVTVCDPREEYALGWSVTGTHLTREMPDDTVLAMHCDRHTAVIALTHDPKLDDLALMEALKSDCFYVGAIGSRANQKKRRERLLEFDVTNEELDRLHGPVGIKNGARTPPEIAVSILAELTAARYGFRIPQPVQL
jgi:xanthine dehydrogenase accessory factor